MSYNFTTNHGWNVIAGSPVLDINKPAGSINDNFVALAGVIASDGKVQKDFDANSHKIKNLGTPVSDDDAATKKYVDDSAIIDPTITSNGQGVMGCDVTMFGSKWAKLQINSSAPINILASEYPSFCWGGFNDPDGNFVPTMFGTYSGGNFYASVDPSHGIFDSDTHVQIGTVNNIPYPNLTISPTEIINTLTFLYSFPEGGPNIAISNSRHWDNFAGFTQLNSNGSIICDGLTITLGNGTGDGSASFASGAITLGSTAGTSAFINSDGVANFLSANDGIYINPTDTDPTQPEINNANGTWAINGDGSASFVSTNVTFNSYGGDGGTAPEIAVAGDDTTLFLNGGMTSTDSVLVVAPTGGGSSLARLDGSGHLTTSKLTINSSFVALGIGAAASGDMIAIGQNSYALGANGIAIGGDAGSGSNNGAEATGDNSIAIGAYKTMAQGAGSIAIGYTAQVLLTNDIAIGYQANATLATYGNNILIGQGTTVTSGGGNVLAIGTQAQASTDGVAIGTNTSAVAGSVAIGPKATATSAQQVVITTENMGSGNPRTELNITGGVADFGANVINAPHKLRFVEIGVGSFQILATDEYIGIKQSSPNVYLPDITTVPVGKVFKIFGACGGITAMGEALYAYGSTGISAGTDGSVIFGCYADTGNVGWGQVASKGLSEVISDGTNWYLMEYRPGA